MYHTRNAANRPARVPQRMMSRHMMERMASILIRRDMDTDTLTHILFAQGYGRRSATAVASYADCLEGN